MASDVPGPWIRRPLSSSFVVVATIVAPIVAPVALLAAAIVDVLTRTPRFRRTRGIALIASLIVIDFIGQVLVFGCWLISPFGFAMDSPRNQRCNQSVMTFWTRRLMSAISLITPLPIDYSELDESLLGGNAIVVGRHRSLLDAVFPAQLFGSRRLTAYYTLKEDLRWEPNIDIVGHRMGHVFVTRSPADLESELEPIRALASRIDGSSVGVIFPEGTFFSETRRLRALASIENANPEHLAQAEKLQYLLPPRPAGTLALLDGAPNADVIMLGHVGFEPFGTIKDILLNMGAHHRVSVRAWRFDRSTVPTDASEQVSWLFDRWIEMDTWIATHHPLSAQAPSVAKGS